MNRILPATVALLAMGGLLLLSACDHPRYMHHGDAGGTAIAATGIFGGANVSVNLSVCSGRVSLTQGEATVRDSCFTGDTNIVLCTDTTSANPIKCAPSIGSLAVAGTGNDVITYARVR